MYLYDYHLHSTHSTDGNHSIMEICERARRLGLKEIALTDHFEPTQKRTKYPPYQARDALTEVLEAKEYFKKNLKVKFGVEMGQPHRFQESSRELLSKNPFDFVLASAHKSDGDVDFGDLDYTRIDILQYTRKYLRELKSLVEFEDFDCVAHFDLVKRYAARMGVKIRLLELKEEVREVLSLIIQKGKGIEVNTSGLRDFAKTCLPDLDIIRLYRNLGGEIITVGSDAHYAQDVGKGIQEALEIIKIAGFRYITTFEERKPNFVPIETKPINYMKYKKLA